MPLIYQCHALGQKSIMKLQYQLCKTEKSYNSSWINFYIKEIFGSQPSEFQKLTAENLLMD
jgi:hypothetical protein